MESGSSHASAPTEKFGKILGLVFLAALGLYILVYSAVESRRPARGPWRVTFITASNQPPMIHVNQPRLGITNMAIVFPTATVSTNSLQEVIFDRARQVPFDLPFGTCIFQDATFLPGTVTMQLFGHELELLPRVMIIDHTEHQWQANKTIVVPHTK